MRVACLGGGPAGLYFAISMKLRDPSHEVVVFERNRADDTFGWGVVLSDEALGNLAKNDPVSAASIRESFAYWDDVAVEFKGERIVSGGHGFCGIGRMKLLLLLQARARELGVDLRFQSPVSDDQIEELSRDYDLVVASDGLNSLTRTRYAEHFQPDVDVRKCKFVWLGTRQKFHDAFTFIFKETEKGWLWAHAYQFDADTATFIVECTEATWNAYGFGEMTKEESIATCEAIFADELGGHSLISNAGHIRGSAWINFPRVLCEKWSYRNIVLMGDAAATAHFSIGSGTRLALDSAIALATYLHIEPTLEAAFAQYQDARRLDVLRLQSAARNSMEWFEEIERYFDLDPVQFTYSLLTRSQRISHENLRLRDEDWLNGAEAWFQTRAGVGANAPVRRPMFAPYKLRGMELKNRIVVSPMAQYKAVDGVPTDWHLVHLGERAKGGAGLVYTEMTCVTPEGRISPGCPGTYSPEAEAAWKRIVDFVHAETDAKICLQLGHSGAKGSTELGWVEDNRPLASGNWPIISASDVPWSPQNQTPEGDGPRRHGPHPRRLRRRRRDGRALRLRHARAAHGPRLPALGLHHAADQHPHRRIRRQPREPHALSARDLPRRPRRLARGEADLGAHLGERLGRRGRHHARGRRRDRPDAAGSRRRHLRRLRRARPRPRRSRSTAACSRPPSPTASATRPAWRRWRSATSTSPTTSTRS